MQTPNGFHATYLENRARSTLFRWFSFFDARPIDIAPMDDILGPEGFVVDFPDAIMRNRAEFVAWYGRHDPPIAFSAHHVRAIRFESVEAARVTVSCDVLWQVAHEGGSLQVHPASVEAELHDQPGPFMRVVHYRARVVPRPK